LTWVNFGFLIRTDTRENHDDENEGKNETKHESAHFGDQPMTKDVNRKIPSVYLDKGFSKTNSTPGDRRRKRPASLKDSAAPINKF